jgi:putative membrane protein
MDAPTQSAVKAQVKAEKAQVKLADSATQLKDSAQLQLESAERRTVLAADRTVYAAERTYAAWMRTGLAALASGVGVRPLLADTTAPWLVGLMSSALLLFSAFCFLAGVWRELVPGTVRPAPDAPKIPPAILVLFTACLVSVAMASLFVAWR